MCILHGLNSQSKKALKTYPQHLLCRLGILLKRFQQLDGVLGRFVGSNRLGQRFYTRLELSLIHGDYDDGRWQCAAGSCVWSQRGR